MNQIPNSILKIKKIYDIIIPSGKVIQDIDKHLKFNDLNLKLRTASPSIKDVLASIGVLAWMFMLKFLLDYLGIFGEIVFLLFIPLSALSHLLGEMNDFALNDDLKTRKFPKGRVVEIFLLQVIYIGIAFFSLRGFIGHTLLANTIALDIGWQTGSPFQTELAFYQLGLGIMAMICLWKRDSIWIGLIYAKAIFLFGAAGVHIWDIVVNHNYSHGNTGTILFVNDLLLPLASIILLHLYLKYRQSNINSVEKF